VARVLLLLCFALPACAPQLALLRDQPAEVSLGRARALSLAVDARPSEAEPAADSMGMARDELQIEPLLALEPLRLAMRKHLAQGRHFQLVAPELSQARLQLFITDYAQQTLQETGWNGRPRASLLGTLAVTVSIQLGAAPPNTFELRVTGKLLDATWNTAELVRRVVDTLAERITSLITPRPQMVSLTLDDSSAAVAPALRLIADQRLGEARTALLELLDDSPDDAAAHHDLGVLEELREDYAAARERYSRAQQLAPSALHQEGLERVLRLEAQPPGLD
jgi:tetratricopeptide (TPR) repeat protein